MVKKMAKLVVGLGFALSLLLVTGRASAGSQDFTVINHTGVEIHALYVSPSKANAWGEDILGQDTLGDGETLSIHFPRSERSKIWDLRIEDQGGNSIEWNELKLNEIETVTLHYKGGKAWADVE
jgi:hypothetical protein